MKNIRNVTRTIGELNLALGRDFDGRYWTFLLGKIGYPEITFEAERGTVTYPEFIPLEDMIQDVLAALDEGQTATCVVCGRYFDLNEEDGIFGDPQNLDRFLCRKCSVATSARDFYYKYLKVRGS